MVDIGAVWDRTVEFISDNLSAVVPIALIGIFVPLSISNSLAPLANSAAPGERSIIYSARILLSLWSLWGKLGITALALDPRGGRQPAIQLAGRRLVPTILASLTLLVAVLVATAPVFIALAITGFDFVAAASGHATPPSEGVRAFIGLYALALVMIGFWVGARLIVLYPTIVMEQRGTGVFARAFRLTRGNVLKIVGVLLLYIIVIFVAQMATQFVFGAIFGLLFGGDGAVSLATILTSIMVGVVATAFTILTTAFVTRLYMALRDARESIVEAR
jgi:hypothetical protein